MGLTMNDSFSTCFGRHALVGICLGLGVLMAAAAQTNNMHKDTSVSTNNGALPVPHCVGRFLIDLPSTAEYMSGRYRYGYFSYETEKVSHAEFKAELSRTEARLKSTKHDKYGSLLVKSFSNNDDIAGFAFWEKYFTTVFVSLEGYKWINDKKHILTTEVLPENTDHAFEFIKRDLNLLVYRPPAPAYPSGPGFCIESAFLPDNGKGKDESVDLRFRLKDKPDVVFDISTTVNLGAPSESLLSRKPGIFSALGILGATLGGLRTIREGDRKIGEYPGQEWLIRAPNDDGYQSHLFSWEAPGLPVAPLHPQIRIDMQTANYDGGLPRTPSSLTDEQALEMWDAIIKTLRLRPTSGDNSGEVNGGPIPESGSAAILPLGAVVRSGAACPQTGYWGCAKNDVHGSTRLFRQGQTMPPAAVRLNLSLFDRMMGKPDLFHADTVWSLVRYDEPPLTPGTAP
jgi:hypothetical protein